MTEDEIEELGRSTYLLMNSCLKLEAMVIFKGVPILHGTEAWRTTVEHITKGRGIRLATLPNEARSL